MNRNQYCCQRCGNLKYDWSGNLCPECLEKDRLRREGKKYFGMSIKMREATKEEKQGVDEYIQSISEKVYTKDEVIAMLKELKTEITEKSYYDTTILGNYEDEVRIELVELDDVNEIIQEKINALGCMESNV